MPDMFLEKKYTSKEIGDRLSKAERDVVSEMRDEANEIDLLIPFHSIEFQSTHRIASRRITSHHVTSPHALW